MSKDGFHYQRQKFYSEVFAIFAVIAFLFMFGAIVVKVVKLDSEVRRLKPQTETEGM